MVYIHPREEDAKFTGNLKQNSPTALERFSYSNSGNGSLVTVRKIVGRGSQAYRTVMGD